MKRKIGIGKVSAWEKPSKAAQAKKLHEDEKRQAFENENAVLIIPAKESTDAVRKHKLRVAAYCRVSTKREEQILSYESQKNHYREHIERNPNWELVGVYADWGLSGTSMKNRTDLLRMIQDCKEGKIDHIITKSLERFSRNATQCMSMIDELLALKPPVSVFFETDNLDSARDRFEMELYFSAIVAQQESVKKSRNIKWRWRLNFSGGKAFVPTHCMLGYDKDASKNIVIVPKEAKVVRFIYNSYLDGMCISEIAAELTKANIPTATGGEVWSSSVIRSMLQNEKYVGDALMQKTYTPNCLSHRSVRNIGQLPMYYKKNHHIGIIPRSDWDEVQKQLELRRYQRPKRQKAKKKFQAKQIRKGMFQGFWIVNPHWSKADTTEFLQQLLIERGNQ